METQSLILEIARRTETKVDGLNARVTAVEIELRTMNKRVNGLNGCTKELAGEVEGISQSEMFREKVKLGRREFIKVAGIVMGAIGVVASITFSIIAVVCH